MRDLPARNPACRLQAQPPREVGGEDPGRVYLGPDPAELGNARIHRFERTAGNVTVLR